MTTQRQIESNRKNAREHATGPRTLEGKEASRRNALKHGLAGQGVVLPEDEAQAVADRAARWAEEFQPETPYKVWLTGQAALESIRVERCQHQEFALRSRLALRAAFCWDNDRRLAAEIVACGIRRRPVLVGRKLRQTAQGCALLLERWRGLVHVLDVNDDLDENQVAMALDLLGIPVEFRTDATLLDLASEAPEADPIEAIRKVALSEIAALEALRAGVLDDLDGAEQGDAEIGLGPDDDATLKRLKRYEADCKRRLNWALEQIAPEADPIEAIAEPSASEPEPEPVIEPVANELPPPEPEPPLEPLPSTGSRPPVAAASYVRRSPLLGASMCEALTPSPESGNRRTRRARRKLAKQG